MERPVGIRIATVLGILALTACSPELMDGASDATLLDCTGDLKASFRFVGPETIELTWNGERYLLNQARSASGARYVGAGAEFWNKGAESMLRIGESRYDCTSVAEGE